VRKLLVALLLVLGAYSAGAMAATRAQALASCAAYDAAYCVGTGPRTCADHPYPANNPPFIRIDAGAGGSCSSTPWTYTPEPSCTAGSSGPSGFFDYGTDEGNTSGFPLLICSSLCEYTFSGAAPAARSLTLGVYHYYAQGTFTGTGSSCTENTDPMPVGATAPGADTCAAGQSMGTVNGKTVCLNSSGQVAPQPPVTKPVETTQKTTGVNTQGETTSTEITTNHINNTTTTTIVTTHPDGSTTTAKTLTADPTPPEDESFSPPLGGPAPTHAGGWYTSKYPDGLRGVWDSRKAALFNSPLGAAIANMAVPVGSGTIPSWTLDLNMGMGGMGNLGVYTIGLPAWLWSVMRVLVLLSAAFVCRRIVFGG